ncbi:peptidoglycan glycosyltransferase FtsI [Buchnera aphidicola (Aphis helianthi)]|uniref:Peptidoglycan D,D-transpeptidase FtsI n=1 Tax=Buchnera aphidicola (Aphis helianthi) TaxID=2315802 RepID=A0A4D6XNG1_9GAMM|nr:peptidoglycan glycosyltransferase FtsI [Buchnera aphidicola]QCI17049.1 peptidoglycan glycosyltransferase FtsI [Buchnera aphidicola (Aphis helianthi)]
MYTKKNIKLYQNKKIKKTIYINWRFIALCIIVFSFLIILTLRIIFLQFIDSEKLSHEGDRRTLRIQSVMNTRGIINDRIGYPLAVTVPVNAVFIDPSIVHNDIEIENNIKWQKLSQILSVPLKKFIFHLNFNKNFKFIYLARQINTNLGQYIKDLKLPGIYLTTEAKRYYPSGKIAAQLIGVNNIDDQGIEGIEKNFNDHLIGKPGRRQIRKDNQGHVIENMSLIHKSNAKNLILSIDKELQNITYQKLYEAVDKNKADFGIAILVDIKTGEILSMATSPAYNPNERQYATSQNFRNRAVSDIFEPGSTVKPIVIMEALKEGLINKNSIINTKPFFINKHQIKDVSYYEKLNIAGILKKSSNVGVSKIALTMKSQDLIQTYLKFGLGQRTNLKLIGEHPGLMPKKKKLSKLEKATFSFGYGLMVTPLQLARLYTTIGSYGVYRPLSIVKINHPSYEKRIFPQKYVKNVLNMLENVIQTNPNDKQSEVKKYRIAIKTGTAKKVGPNGRYIKKYVAYTAGVAPADNPKFSLVIVIDNPKGNKYYGGAVSAPVFNQIMVSVLDKMKIKPDNL